MKIVIVSDIHSNLAALRALPERDYDQLWCAGDLVDYGPRPREVIHEIQSRAAVVVSGNHDYAAGFSADPRCSAPYRRLAAETLRYTQEICSDEHLLFLRNLPRFQELAIGETRFYIVHATPTDPLFAYSPEGSDRWVAEAEAIQADVLVVGHTHTPFIRVVGSTTIVNSTSTAKRAVISAASSWRRRSDFSASISTSSRSILRRSKVISEDMASARFTPGNTKASLHRTACVWHIPHWRTAHQHIWTKLRREVAMRKKSANWSPRLSPVPHVRCALVQSGQRLRKLRLWRDRLRGAPRGFPPVAFRISRWLLNASDQPHPNPFDSIPASTRRGDV